MLKFLFDVHSYFSKAFLKCDFKYRSSYTIDEFTNFSVLLSYKIILYIILLVRVRHLSLTKSKKFNYTLLSNTSEGELLVVDVVNAYQSNQSVETTKSKIYVFLSNSPNVVNLSFDSILKLSDA